MNRFPRSLVGWTFPTILKSELLNLHLGTHEIWNCPISLTMPSLRTLDPVDLAKGNCRWEPAAKTGGLPGDHLSTCYRCWCPLSNQKKTVTGMIRFGLPTLITCIGVQSLSAGIPFRNFLRSCWVFSQVNLFPPKNRTSYSPWNFLYWEVHLSP